MIFVHLFHSMQLLDGEAVYHKNSICRCWWLLFQMLLGVWSLTKNPKQTSEIPMGLLESPSLWDSRSWSVAMSCPKTMMSLVDLCTRKDLLNSIGLLIIAWMSLYSGMVLQRDYVYMLYEYTSEQRSRHWWLVMQTGRLVWQCQVAILHVEHVDQDWLRGLPVTLDKQNCRNRTW